MHYVNFYDLGYILYSMSYSVTIFHSVTRSGYKEFPIVLNIMFKQVIGFQAYHQFFLMWL